MELDNKPDLAICLWNMSNIFEDRKNFTQAINLSEQAIVLWQSCQIPTDKYQQQLERLKQAAKAYEAEQAESKDD